MELYMKRTLLLLFVLLVNTNLFADIIVGTLSYDPPFEYVVNNKDSLAGFEIDLMNAVCKKINEKCQYKPMLIKSIFEQVNEGTIDLAIASIAITKERQANFLFSIPYLESKYQLITLIDSPINKASDINGKTLGVVKGSLFEDLAYTLFKNIKLVESASDSDLYSNLTQKKVQAILVDYLMAKFWQSNSSDELKLVGEGLPIGNGYGIISKKSNTALINNINQALTDLENDGTYLRLYEQYF